MCSKAWWNCLKIDVFNLMNHRQQLSLCQQNSFRNTQKFKGFIKLNLFLENFAHHRLRTAGVTYSLRALKSRDGPFEVSKVHSISIQVQTWAIFNSNQMRMVWRHFCLHFNRVIRACTIYHITPILKKLLFWKKCQDKSAGPGNKKLSRLGAKKNESILKSNWYFSVELLRSKFKMSTQKLRFMSTHFTTLFRLTLIIMLYY